MPCHKVTDDVNLPDSVCRDTDEEAVLAVLRIDLRPGKARRSDQAGDAEVAHGFTQAGATGGMTSDKSPSHQTNNGDKALHKPEHMWQQIHWRLMPQTPVGRAIVSATQRLDDAGSSTPNLDAQVILAHVLQVERSWLFAHYDYELTQDEAERYSDAVARRAAAEPVAYIVGKKEFYGLELLVDRRVLAPRPETEMLVDAVLDWIERRPGRAVTVADIGTGSGAIALAVAANCPDVTVYATDVSQEALTVAASNIACLDARDQVRLLQGDLLASLPEKVDIIAANLPYIRSDDFPGLQADVRDYEPKLALEAGPEGLDLIERLLAQLPAYLKPGGAAFLEIGHDQREAVLALAERLLPGAHDVAVREDYHGRDRLLIIGF